MTLRRQLILIIASLFLLLFFGTFSIDVHNTRAYLNDQLTTVSQDMATSMGLTLSPYMSDNDMAIVESHVNAMFDSGYYQEITITDVDGNPLIQRISDRPVEQVPDWFIRLFPLETPVGESMLMNGWNQAGSLRVSAHPEFAYVRMWASCKQSFYLFVACFAFLFAFLLVLMHFILRPLKLVTQQAQAISNKDYVIQQKVPHTKELKEVVLAMNMMSGKLKDIFFKQETLLQRTREEAYTDSATGLSNRTHFNVRLMQMLESDSGLRNGFIVFLEVCHLIDINKKLGFAGGNRFLKAVSTILENSIQSFNQDEVILARLTGTTFAVVLKKINEEQIEPWGKQLLTNVKELFNQEISPYEEICHIGITAAKSLSFSELLSQADISLRSAQIQGPNALHINKQKTQSQIDTLTATQWISLLNNVIKTKHISLLKQKVVSSNDLQTEIHQEIFLRIANDKQQIIPAGLFIPMVHHYGLTKELDQMIIDIVIDELKQHPTDTSFAINLMGDSIKDSHFVSGLYDQLKQVPEISKHLCFELNDYAVSLHLDEIKILQEKLRTLGVRIGIDHFGRNMISFTNFRPDYIKIDGSFIHNIDTNRNNLHFVDILAGTAHANDIQIIAESIETEAERSTIRDLGIDGEQGYGIHHPCEWINFIDSYNQKTIS